jgi:hypothetical protein
MGVKLGNGKWAIKEDKLLAYNDNSGRFFNKEFDFSRGSSATYVAKDGLIKTAGLQATNLVNNGDFSELGSELITNGNFDTDSDWNGVNANGTSISNGSLNYSNTSLNHNISQGSVVTIGKPYQLIFTISNYEKGSILPILGAGGVLQEVSGNGTYTMYGTASINETFYFQARGTDGTTLSIDNVSVKQVDPNDYWTVGGSWSLSEDKADYLATGNGSSLSQSNVFTNTGLHKISFTISEVASGQNARILIESSSEVYLPLTSLGNGNYTYYVNATASNNLIVRGYTSGSGVAFSISNISIQEVQADTPRIDFSDSVKGALLLEPSSTQLIQYSEDFSQWSGINSSRASILKNQVISPDGSITADRLSDADNSSNYHNLFQYLTFTSGNPYVFSFFAKAGTSDYVNFYLDNGHCAFQFSTKTLSGANSSNCTYTEFENGWYLLTFYKSSLSSTSRPISIYTGGGTSDSDGSYIGNPSKNVFIWGAQVEAGNYRTSYIPNHGVSGGVTRLADVCNNSGSAQDFSEEGVLYCEIAALANDGTSRQISLSDGSNANNKISLRYTSTTNELNAFVKSGGSVVFNESEILSDTTQNNKLALKYKQNDFSLYVNGVEVATDSNGNTPTGLNVLDFDSAIGTLNFYGKVREVQVFTEALTDEQLEKLTTI